MVRFAIVSILALCLSATVEATRFYKWVDEDGVVHYSDSPPDHSRYEQIQTREPASSFQELEEQMREDADEAEAAAEAAAPARAPQSADEARRMNCENARNNLQTLQSFQNIQMDLDGDGELDTLTEEQKAEQIERMQAQIERFCESDE